MPSAFVVLDDLPLSPNGKLDRRALPRAGRRRGRARRLRRARGPTPSGHWREIWAIVLGVEQIGVDDDFFALGGDSILSFRALSLGPGGFRLGAVRPGGVRCPTISRLAALLPGSPCADAAGGSRAAGAGSRRIATLAAVAGTATVVVPGRADARLATEYNTGIGLRLSRSAGHRRRCASVLAALAARHESLRTTFAHRRRSGARSSLAVATLRCGCWTWRTDRAATTSSTGLLAESTARRFDLRRGPLIRVRLVRLRTDDHVLLLDQHHIVTDGWSVGILVEELAELYGARRRSTAADLPELPIQYPDFAVWQRERPSDERCCNEQLDYWQRRARAASRPLDLPTDRPRPRGAHDVRRGAPP